MSMSKTSILRCLARDERGNVAMTFGLMSVVLFLFVGAAVDVGRWLHAKQATKSAMDAAVLAGTRALQLDSTDIEGALLAAQRFYEANTEGRLPLESDTVSFTTADANTAITAQGNAYITTPVLSLANIEHLPLFADSTAEYSKAVVSVGGSSETNLEISLMLDVTGSMAGDKLTDMQEAAKDLIDIVVWEDQSHYTSRVALVPFSQAVNVGATYFNAISNQNTNSTLTDLAPSARHADADGSPFGGSVAAILRTLQEFSFIQSAEAARRRGGGGSGGGGNGGDDDDHNSGGGSSANYDPCVVDRDGANVFTDAPPSPGNYFDVYDVAKQSNYWTKDMACRPSSVTIQPLTNDKDVLNAKIDRFVANGYTAGHIGTAFAWYMLSPNWADIWPEASTPASYDDAGTQKIAVLMTDGEYNTSYNGTGNGTASEQAVALCTAMKDEGVTVYTVGFALGGNRTAVDTLADCATDSSHAYIAESGDELRQAFRDIALKISQLHLSR